MESQLHINNRVEWWVTDRWQDTGMLAGVLLITSDEPVAHLTESRYKGKKGNTDWKTQADDKKNSLEALH